MSGSIVEMGFNLYHYYRERYDEARRDNVELKRLLGAYQLDCVELDREIYRLRSELWRSRVVNAFLVGLVVVLAASVVFNFLVGVLYVR